MRPQSPLYCSVIGRGEPIVFVHGDSLFGSPVDHWRQQLPLADEYQLILPARHGYYLSPVAERETFAYYAGAIVDLLGEGAHLVGHSYGGVIALLAAAARPEAVYTLTVSEPPAFALARGHPDVEAFIQRIESPPKPVATMTPEEFTVFLHDAIFHDAIFGTGDGTPSEVPPRVRDLLATEFGRRGTEANMREPAPWQAEISLAALADAPFSKLVLSSGSVPMHEAVCAVLVDRLGAEHALIPEAGHFIPFAGEPYNQCLRAFLREHGPYPHGRIPFEI